MIAGGNNKYNRSAYILNVQFEKDNSTKISEVALSSLGNIPFNFEYGFYESCEGRLIIGGGSKNNQVAELDGVEWMDDLPSTKIQRYGAASVYHSGTQTLIVSGGYDRNDIDLDSIEMLKIDTNGN